MAPLRALRQGRFGYGGLPFARTGRFDRGGPMPLGTLRRRGLSRRGLPNSFERAFAASGRDDVEDAGQRAFSLARPKCA